MKGDASADKRLLTNRWRADSQEAAIDPNHDGNMFSFYYRSRLDIRLARRRTVHLRGHTTELPGLVANDGQPADYSYLKVDTSPDGGR